MQAAENSLAAEIRLLHRTICLTDERVRTADENADVHAQIVETVSAQVEAGVKTAVERGKAELALAQAQSDLARYRAERQLEVLQLEQKTGLTASEERRLVASGDLFAAGRAEVDRAELRQEALEHRQEPAVAAARLRAAGLNLSAVRRERYPWISYVQLAHQSRSALPVVRWSFQVGVELPVFRLRSPAVRASSVRMLQAELENRAARAAVIA